MMMGLCKAASLLRTLLNPRVFICRPCLELFCKCVHSMLGEEKNYSPLVLDMFFKILIVVIYFKN